MAILQQVRAEYELSKYLQLFRSDEALFLAVDAGLRGCLNDRVELTIVRLAVQGAFLVLNDANHLHFAAGGHKADADDNLSRVEFDSGEGAWLHVGEVDRPTWISLFQEIIAINPESASERAFSIPDLKRDPRTCNLSAVSEPPQASFFAGVPLTSKNGHNIGAICVVDRTERPPLSTFEADFLADTARRCTNLLELAREHGLHKRWTALQEELDVFLQSRSLHTQLIEEPQTPAGCKYSIQQKNASGAERVDPNALADDPLSGIDDPPVEGAESQRLVDAAIERDHRIAEHDNAKDAQLLIAERGKDNERGLPKGETTYRRTFRRAAKCLRSALKADGVLFVDGVMGFHGDVQLVAEPEQELEREIARPLVHRNTSAQEKSLSKKDQNNSPEDTFKPHDARPPDTHSRIYTSAEYLKGFYVERPAEVLGISGPDGALKLARVSHSTIGLPDIDEGFLQRLMDRHPHGAVWHSFKSGFMQVKNETLVEIDLQEEVGRLTSTFENIRQLVFQPLTDPTSLKRLGACFAWRNKSIPLLTDAVDLESLKAFLRVVESEIMRYDALLLAKQKDAFVSSVSHELRTPLHGILGAVQLLDESGLDPMQKSLAGMITTCGSTLHETLTSVLSYAKINQFERRQHEYRQRRPPDTIWALSDKKGLASGPDRDYQGLYICTNLAMLCEEILGVHEAAKSFQISQGSEVIVVCNIKHEDNWSYYTEPGALRRITVNLVGNALKYTKSGSIIVTLSTSKVIEDPLRVSNDLTSGRTLTLNIRDTGRGISKEFMDNQLFLPFTQEDPTSTHGVGLGMSIVKSLISLLSGEIQVQSEESKGTEINIRIPLRMCKSDVEKGQAALEFERNIQTIRNRKLSAVIYGFTKFVRESLTNYLCDWYDCTLLEPMKDSRPDIVLVDEGNRRFWRRLGKRMDTIDGYIKWERILRPLGPNNVAKGLLSCLEKLNELQKYGENASVDMQGTGTESEPPPLEGPANLQELKESPQDEQYVPSLEKLQTSEASQSLLPSLDLSNSLPDHAISPSNREQTAATEQMRRKSTDQQVNQKPKSLGILRILIVDDNALNLRLLRAFFKKNGYRDTKQSKHGREAVEAAQDCDEGFNIIFMDLSMPIMDGFEATRQIRKMEAGRKRAPAAMESVIIALTGLASQQDEEEAFNAGVDLFLTKPVQFPKLSNLLREYEEGTLKRRRPLKECG
ncbi:hypothetical protein T440DRAFT_512414 [Plenodomus tracheiphilus IPT5]|uniref:Sensor histidine kinase-like protein/response regulator n=1 Tax=Plenodomus tracheiphilus IPT5 TaxID=1408161 RepID=A0A6A7ALP0_9PLEO|nr:hypothetical protein T440DRAFT_512414 [Plenodomus tracheiphilus IPT5]